MGSHLRSAHKGRHSTQAEHMPKSHREHAEWTPQRLVRWAEHTGPNTVGVISRILERRIHPTHSYRACLSILRLGKTYGEERLELACRRALSLGACSYKSLESILRQGLERLPHPTLDKLQTLRLHGILKALAEQRKPRHRQSELRGTPRPAG